MHSDRGRGRHGTWGAGLPVQRRSQLLDASLRRGSACISCDLYRPQPALLFSRRGIVEGTRGYELDWTGYISHKLGTMSATEHQQGGQGRDPGRASPDSADSHSSGTTLAHPSHCSYGHAVTVQGVAAPAATPALQINAPTGSLRSQFSAALQRNFGDPNDPGGERSPTRRWPPARCIGLLQ